MYQLDEDQAQIEPIETLHIYVYQEEEKKPLWQLSPASRDTMIALLGLIILVIGMLALCFIPGEPAYTIQTVSVRAHFLPLVQFNVVSTIIPAGSKTYPATYGEGRLTIYNGSILTQELPAGFIVTSQQGVEVATEANVTIPPGSPPSYGVAIVSAHAVSPGRAGNIAAYGVNAVYGADVYIKNLSAFTGGAGAHTVTYATSDDTYKALANAHYALSTQENRHTGLLATPCQEKTAQKALMLTVSWMCQFVTFTPPPGAQVLSARVVGSQVLLRVKIVIVSHLKALPGK